VDPKSTTTEQVYQVGENDRGIQCYGSIAFFADPNPALDFDADPAPSVHLMFYLNFRCLHLCYNRYFLDIDGLYHM
jgi:hypothetical protein